MTTIPPLEVARRLANHDSFDLIDVRPKKEFNHLHIRGARSAPLNQMSPAKVLRERKRSDSEPLFVIGEDRILAGMAAGMLRAAGCHQPVVVDGGMEAWQAHGLPASHRLIGFPFSITIPA
jgi:rhodanese-related sulfurtransferase